MVALSHTAPAVTPMAEDVIISEMTELQILHQESMSPNPKSC